MAPKAKIRPQAKRPPFPTALFEANMGDKMVDYSYVDHRGIQWFCCHFASGWREWFLASYNKNCFHRMTCLHKVYFQCFLIFVFVFQDRDDPLELGSQYKPHCLVCGRWCHLQNVGNRPRRPRQVSWWHWEHAVRLSKSQSINPMRAPIAFLLCQDYLGSFVFQDQGWSKRWQTSLCQQMVPKDPEDVRRVCRPMGFEFVSIF